MASKIFNKYQELKKDSSDTIYLFKSGIFYIALNEDAKILHEKLNLNITDFGIEYIKCGFPASALEKYKGKLTENNIQFQVIENIKEERIDILKEIKNLNLNNMTPMEAYQKLIDFQKILKK